MTTVWFNNLQKQVKDELLNEGLALEGHGGDIPVVELSALTGMGLDKLVETLSAMAELQDLRAEQDGQILGYVIESKTTKGFGYVLTRCCTFI